MPVDELSVLGALSAPEAGPKTREENFPDLDAAYSLHPALRRKRIASAALGVVKGAGIFLFLLFAAGGSLAYAQNSPPAAPDLVPVHAIVTVEARDHDQSVPSLSNGDVMAYERRERLRVTDLLALNGDHAGLELFCLLDDSSSTSLGSHLEDLRRFIEAQPPTTAVGVGYMRNGTVDIVQQFTNDHSRAAQSLRLPFGTGGGAASPFLSLSDLIKRWPGNSVRREIVMVTSGVDSFGGSGPMNPYVDPAIEAALRNEIVVYAIYMPGAGHTGHSYYAMNWGQNHLAQIADGTGGEAYMLGFESPVSIGKYLEEISVHLAHQYRVTFLMKPGNKSGLRNVRFATEVPNADLVSASSVYVPASHAQPAR